jgi:acyl-CoA dehydrogenase
MAVRTGDRQLSLLVVPLKGEPGVSVRRLKVAGQISAGTSFIELDDVKVPVENLIGQEGMGMKYIMKNFNHEVSLEPKGGIKGFAVEILTFRQRLSIAVGVTRQARVALSAAFAYCLKREAFGKPLMDQPVVRNRLANAGVRLETLWSWIEHNMYLLSQLPTDVADVELGGVTAAMKAEAGRVLEECANTAVLLFGGNGYTRTGQGELVESELFIPLRSMIDANLGPYRALSRDSRCKNSWR